MEPIPGATEARAWIEAVTALKFSHPTFRDSLKSGVLLCLLLNKLRVGSVKIKNPSKYPPNIQPQICIENLTAYVSTLPSLGLPSEHLFAPNDLYLGENVARVVQHIFWLANSAINQSGVALPPLPIVVAATAASSEPVPGDEDYPFVNQVPAGGSDDEDDGAAVVGASVGSITATNSTSVNSVPASPVPPAAVGGGGGGGDGGNDDDDDSDEIPPPPPPGDGRVLVGRAKAGTVIGLAPMPSAHPTLATPSPARPTPMVAGEAREVGEARALFLGEWLPQLLAQNRQLKDRVNELEDKNSDLARENEELQKRLEQLSSQSTAAGGGDEGVILGNYNGQVALKAGVPEKLVEALYNPAQPGANEYTLAFLTTFRAWSEPASVLEQLERAFLAIATAEAASDQVVQESRRQTVLLMCNVVKKWLERFYGDFAASEELRARLAAFIPKIDKFDEGLGAMIKKALTRAQKRHAALEKQTAANAAGEIANKKMVNNNMAPGGVAPSPDCIAVFNKPAPEPVVSKRAPKEVEEIDTLELARQISLMMFAAFSRVQAHELLGNSFSSKHKQTLAPNIVKLTDQFNDFSRWVMYNVVTQMDLKKRAALVRKFVLMAEELRRLNNLNGVFAIVAGLSGAPVHRLKRTWEIVLKDKKTSEWWEYQLDLTNPQSSFGKYRAAKALCEPPAVPYLGVYLQDLTFIEEGNNDKLENGYINFVKFRMIADIVSEIQTFQLRQYNLRDVPSIQNYLLMTRILDEEKLFALSLTVEPRAPKK